MTDAEQLAARSAADPHSYLGAHPDGKGGAVIRAFRPAASAVTAVTAEGERTALASVHPAGVFEGTVKRAELPLAYELEVDYGEDGTFTVGDPYRFLPTLGEMDLHLAGEGRHEQLYSKLGAHVIEHQGAHGTAFAVWAPSARSVSVVGDFNSWDGRLNPMRALGSSGIWELFLPAVGPGARYKFEILTQAGEIRLKADPLALATELPPLTASVVFQSTHEWADQDWLATRREVEQLEAPISIYEVHLGSWRLNTLEGNRSLTFHELADELSAYARDMGFTHIELMPVMAHPYSGSWGYQVTGYFATTPRYGTPDEFRGFVDRLHQNGLGVILDWVPAHFPRDEFALARFDGTALYEHEDPRRGAHPDWGTLVFNFGRNEVRNFLLANALFWLREYHADGIRVDAVASMLYLDYSREEGQWVPNEFGGNEDLDAVGFLKQLNELIYAQEPGAISAAEESTAWPGVSRPTYLGGLGFGFKWNMGWMHDTLAYFQLEPIHRRWHHHELTFSLVYAFTENFILPLSHDEVVHGKGSMLSKMPGDRWQQLANLRALYAFMWAHPGKKLLFMGNEIAQEQEWSEERSLDWHLLEDPEHSGVQALVRDLNHAYRATPALWERDQDGTAFWWLEPNDAEASVFAFARIGRDARKPLVFVANLTPVPRTGYRMGLPVPGRWIELVNTDAAHFGGSGQGNLGGVEAEDAPWMGQFHSAELTLPPLGALWLVPEAAAMQR
ncbi:MAG TPA: 1,4-alpha-glucan branching protein GlgB [Solirubrobacteraceae bacterium]|nr:1,4-alpha-glucan branching protein GlgB [Solirubrobacteraceae bacterium]